MAESTRSLLGRSFESQEVSARDLTFHCVRREVALESRFQARQAGPPLPLVGRRHELELLLERWRQAASGEGQVVLLVGEPGIGKSRLVEALFDRLGSEDFELLRYQCTSYFANTPLHPIVERLERMAELRRDDVAETKLAKLEAWLGGSAGDVAPLVPLFADLLSIPIGEGSPPLPPTPQQRREALLGALVDGITERAARRPVLVDFEDAHWIDPSSLEFLDRLVARAANERLLLLVTFRPEFTPPPWIGNSHITVLTLGRLSQEQGRAMVGHVAAGRSLPAEVLTQIIERADGVPLFVEELTKTVVESKMLREEGDRYVLAQPLLSLAIPETLQASLMERLDRLAQVKEVAQVAAVIGREFSHDLLATVAPLPEEQLRAALAQLTNAALVFRRGSPPEASYSFKHALVQDAAYQSLLKSRRQQLHARIAKILERRFPDSVKVEPELVARHYTAAGLREQAIDYWHRAGQLAAQRFAHKEAAGHLTRGLDLLKSLPNQPEHARQEIRLQNALGVSLMVVKGPVPQVAEEHLRARELAERIGDTRQAYTAVWGLWHFDLVRMKLRTARDHSCELLELAKREKDKELLLQAHHAAWPILLYGGELLLCREHAEDGLSLYDPYEHRSHALRYGGHDPGVCCRYHRALALWLLGCPDQAVAVARDAVRLAEELAQPGSLAIALVNASYLHQFRGEAWLAQEQAEATIARSVEQGLLQAEARGTIMRGWAVATRGELEAGTAAVRNGLAALHASGAHVRRSYYLALLAELCWRADRPEAGQLTISEALAFAEDSGERWWEADLHRLKGELLLAQSTANCAEAEVCFYRALEVAQRQSAKAFELRAATSLARLWSGRGKPAEARDVLEPIYKWFTEGFDTMDLIEAKELLDALA